VEEVAAAHGRAGRRLAAARWRLIAADALARGGVPQAADVAELARAELAAMGADGWRLRAERLLRRLGRRVTSPASGPGHGTLTARESEVMRLLAEGLSNRAIAERLVISEKTAGRHVANAYAKLGVHTRVEATRAAIERGLLETPDGPSTAT
jgi:DNA-binding NarL/FixJ family response regulator